MSSRFSRRDFLKSSTVAASLAAANVSVPAFSNDKAPSNKLNVAVVGPCNRGAATHSEMLRENVVALCDIDTRNLDNAGRRSPQAQKFQDFRKMFEQVKDLDAVCVCTPDHTHAAPSVMGMRAGLHCYTEKPLAHDVRECRVMEDIAIEKKLCTQMGTQIHATDNYRRVVELVQAGAIGAVKDVYVWCGKGWGLPADAKRPTDTPAIPANIDWDCWVGPAAMRPYNSCYLPGQWRKWWAFGNGTLGDMACHIMDLAFWALKLRDCLTVEAVDGPAVNAEGCPLNLAVDYTFAARGEGYPACTLHWFDGGKTPDVLKTLNIPGRFMGVLFVGEKGQLFADYGSRVLYPVAQYADFKAPEKTIPNSIGHHAEWLQAIRDNNPEACTCKFGYSGRLTETVLLGTIAYRTGKKLEWDANAMKITNVPEANDLITCEYRDGWIL